MNRIIISTTILCLGFLILSGSAAPNEVIDSITGLSRPMTISEKIKAKRLNIPLTVDKEVATVVAEYVNRPWRHTDNEARVVRVDKDELGYTHVRMKQFYKGVECLNNELISHVNNRNQLYLFSGEFVTITGIDTSSIYSIQAAIQKCIIDASIIYCKDATSLQCFDVDTLFHLSASNISQLGCKLIGNPKKVIFNNRFIAYEIFVRDSLVNMADWAYIVDAETGKILHKNNTISDVTLPPTDIGYDTTLCGIRASFDICLNANDSTANMLGWKDTGIASNKRYFLYYKGDASSQKASWRIFNMHNNGFYSDTSSDSLCRWAQYQQPNLGMADREIVSLAKNVDTTVTWLREALSWYGLDSLGKYLRVNAHTSLARMPRNKANAFWAPLDTAFYFSVSDTGVNAGLREPIYLDYVAHEINHAVSNYCWLGMPPLTIGGVEECALSEGYSDVAAANVEFYGQVDSSVAYPRRVKGCADWYVGEDATLKYQALRDFNYLFRRSQLDSVYLGKCTYYDGSYSDSGAYHQMGVLLSAFYLLAVGNPDSIRNNNGNPVSVFQGIGISNASKIAFRARQCYLVPYSLYVNVRDAWYQAAFDLIENDSIPSNSLAVAESAWIAVGLSNQNSSLTISDGSRPIGMIGKIGSLKSAGVVIPWTPLSGLKVAHTRTGSGISFYNGASDPLQKVRASNAIANNVGPLNQPIGGLIFIAPNDSIVATIDTTGNLRTKGWQLQTAF